MKPRSDFSYEIRQIKGKPFIMIEDLNHGRMSVTNDIENVIEYICNKENINPVEHYIIYKDSDGIWDGYEFAIKNFVVFRQRHWMDAAKKLLEG